MIEYAMVAGVTSVGRTCCCAADATPAVAMTDQVDARRFGVMI